MAAPSGLASPPSKGQPFDHSASGLRESKVASNAYFLRAAAIDFIDHALRRTGILHLFILSLRSLTGESAAVRTAPGKVVLLGDNIVAGCLRHTDAFAGGETSRAGSAF